MSEVIDIRIDSIAAGGDGVGRHDGIVVFVPRTAPGDLVRVHGERRDRLMRGRLDAVLEASASRVAPPCEHYVADRCGGCQIQHLDYPAQLHAKAVIIRDSLARIGKVALDVPRVVRSDREFRYRVKLTLALRHQGGRWIAGLHRYDAPDEVFALRDCPITHQAVLEIWASVMEQQQRLPVARELRGAVRLTEDGAAFTLEGGREWPGHDAFFEAVATMTELWWTPKGKSRRLLHTRAGRSAGASFVQVNPAVAADLQERVIALVTGYRPTTVVDAYAGIGDFAARLADNGARVIAIELDRAAARVAASRLPEGSRTISASVEDALGGALPADVVILNPPRTGIDARVATLLNTSGPAPSAVIYVSCNPATLARDIRRLERYRIKSVVGFDMFPQTAHVETVCELVPAA